MPAHFDHAQIETAVRDGAERNFEAALARQTTTEGRQTIEAQYALIEATIIQTKVFADMIGNDVSLDVIVAAMGSHTGNIVATMLRQAEPEDGDLLLSLFVTRLTAAVDGIRNRTSGTTIVTGIQGGRA